MFYCIGSGWKWNLILFLLTWWKSNFHTFLTVFSLFSWVFENHVVSSVLPLCSAFLVVRQIRRVKKTCIVTLLTINSTRYGGWEVWIIEFTNYSVMYNTWRLAGSRVTTRRTGGKTRKPSSACATAPLTSFRSSRRVTSYLYTLFGWVSVAPWGHIDDRANTERCI